MNWTQTVFEVIDMRSFSNLWFWIALAVMWSSASYWVLGVPFDMMQRVMRGDQKAISDLQKLVQINVTRVLYITDKSGMWLVTITCFVMTSLVILGFVYDVEFAQALFLLGFPMLIVRCFIIRMAYVINDDGYAIEGLIRRLLRQRLITQFIGMISILITAMYGMLQNFSGGNGF